MKLRFAALTIYLLVLLSPHLLAQASSSILSPDRAEIESARAASVVFINFEGPQPRIDTLAAIKGLGEALGREVAGASASSTTLRALSAARYQVIRAADPSVKLGLDADILILGADSQVDHVRNLRWIIAGYLTSAWGYAEKDAYTLATFITIYDAVHRGDMQYFGSKYKAVVLKELTPETAGLALSYKEWPGKSRIVIPLSYGASTGKLGAVDTGAVSDKAVAESLKALPDKGIADRQALVDVKAREAAQRQADVDKQKAELAQAEKKLAEDRAKAEADRAALEKAKAAAAATTARGGAAPGSAAPNAAASAATTPSAAPNAAAGVATSGKAAPSAAQPYVAPVAGSAAEQTATAPAATAPPAAAPAAELAIKEAAVKAEEAAVAAKAADLAAKKEEAAKAEAAAAAKKKEVAADRKDITVDQKAVIAAEVAAKSAGAFAGSYLVRVGEDADHLGQIVFVDPDKGTIIRVSRINSLHLRSLAELSDAFVAVSGLEGKSGGVKLVKLDKTSLESVAQGVTDMFAESSILVSGASIYAVAKASDGKFYLARFAATDLSEQTRSKVAVTPYTVPRLASRNIAVQVPGSSFILLKTDTLEKTMDLKP